MRLLPWLLFLVQVLCRFFYDEEVLSCEDAFLHQGIMLTIIVLSCLGLCMQEKSLECLWDMRVDGLGSPRQGCGFLFLAPSNICIVLQLKPFSQSCLGLLRCRRSLILYRCGLCCNRCEDSLIRHRVRMLFFGPLEGGSRVCRASIP